MTIDTRTDSFRIERTLNKCPAHVFSAWSDPSKKLQWFRDPAMPDSGYVCDFSVGGREYGAFESEMGRHENETRYFEIVQDELIVFAYSMALNGRVHSVSLVTLRFDDQDGGTRLTYVEQMCVIGQSDGAAGRQHGWGALLNRMQAVLEQEMAPAS